MNHAMPQLAIVPEEVNETSSEESFEAADAAPHNTGAAASLLAHVPSAAPLYAGAAAPAPAPAQATAPL